MVIVKNLWRVAGVGFYKTGLAPTGPARPARLPLPGAEEFPPRRSRVRTSQPGTSAAPGPQRRCCCGKGPHGGGE